jgi:DNA-binding transcriptional regulator WhiA
MFDIFKTKKQLIARVKELERINECHRIFNGTLITENNSLMRQINEQTNRLFNLEKERTAPWNTGCPKSNEGD